MRLIILILSPRGKRSGWAVSRQENLMHAKLFELRT
jgi:hypothetical protein